jgi:hypothetical protein
MKILLTFLVVATTATAMLAIENWLTRNQTSHAEMMSIMGILMCIFALLVVLIIHFGRLA